MIFNYTGFLIHNTCFAFCSKLITGKNHSLNVAVIRLSQNKCMIIYLSILSSLFLFSLVLKKYIPTIISFIQFHLIILV